MSEEGIKKMEYILTEESLVDMRESLVEMYKAGFLDAWKINIKGFDINNQKQVDNMNKFYLDCFMKRFETKITKELKKHEQKRKKSK